MKFLVVDNSPTQRRIINNALQRIGFGNVVEAEDGKAALTRLGKEEVDFIITDWNMPNIDGLQLTRAIRNSEKLKHLPVLMITSRCGKEDVIKALQAQVDSYMTRPFTPQQLKEKILHIIQAKKNID